MLHDGMFWYNQLSICLPIVIDGKCSSFHFLFLPHYYNCNCYCYTITAIVFVSIYPVIPLLLLVLLVVLCIDLLHQFLNNWNNTNRRNGHLPCTNPALKMSWNSFVYRCWWKLHFGRLLTNDRSPMTKYPFVTAFYQRFPLPFNLQFLCKCCHLFIDLMFNLPSTINCCDNPISSVVADSTNDTLHPVI